MQLHKIILLNVMETCIFEIFSRVVYFLALVFAKILALSQKVFFKNFRPQLKNVTKSICGGQLPRLVIFFRHGILRHELSISFPFRIFQNSQKN